MSDSGRPPLPHAPTIAIATTALDDVPQPSLTVTGITTGVEDGQRVTVTLYGKNYDAVVLANAWSASIPVAAAVLPDDGYRVTASVSNKAGIPAPPDTQTWKRRESGLDLPPEQTPELEQAASEARRRWITKEKALEWFQEQCATWVEAPYTTCTPSPGYAQELLAKARASGQVHYTNARVTGVLPKDGVSDPGSQFDLFFNLDDLVGWRDRHMSRKDPAPAVAEPAPAPAPPPPYRPPPTIEQRVAAIAKGLWPTGRPPEALKNKEATHALEKYCKTHSIALDFDKHKSQILRALGRKKK